MKRHDLDDALADGVGPTGVPAPDHGATWGEPAGVQGGRRPSAEPTRSALDADRGTPILNDRGQGPATTFGDLAPVALAVRRMSWSPGSASRFDGVHRNYVAPRWSNCEFDRIDRRAVLGWVAQLQAAGIGPATVTKVLAVFRAVWAEARRDGIAGDDPTAGLTVRKPPHVMGRSLNEDELTRLIAATDDPPTRAQLLLTGVVGMRWGELAGLNCGDLDLDEHLIHIRASLARGDAGYEVKGPKTTGSARAVPIPEVMTGLLRTVLDGRAGGALFVSNDGLRRLNYHTSRRRLIRTADAASVLDCTGWHVLRRTAGTLALRAGLNLRDVQKLLGHQSPSLTLSAYVAARESLALVGPLNRLATSAMGR